MLTFGSISNVGYGAKSCPRSRVTAWSRPFIIALAVVGLFATAPAAAAAAQDDALQMVQQGIDAMGGAAALRGLRTLSIRGRAQHWAPGESFETGGPPRFVGDAAFLTSSDFGREATRTEWNRSFKFPFPHPQGFIEIVLPQSGFVQGVDATDAYRTLPDLTSSPPAHAMSGVRLATEQRELARRSPRFLLEALQAPERLTMLSAQELQGIGWPALQYRAERSTFTVVFDPRTRLPARIRVRDEDALQGDSDFDLVLSDWRRQGGLSLPWQMDYELNGVRIAHVDVQGVIVNPDLPAHLFRIEPGAAEHASAPVAERVTFQWVIRRQFLGLYLDTDAVNFDPARGGLRLVSLAPGIDQVLGGTHNSLIVAMKDHLVVFDAPIDEWQSQWTMAAAGEKYPDKPVKYLVLSHHHVDHSGGVRTYVARGAAVVVAKGDKAFFDTVFRLPHTIAPDELQQQPREATIVEVDGKRVLGDGERTLELYVVQNEHVRNMLIGYVPDARLCFVVDLWSPLRDTRPTGGQRALFDAVMKLGLEPDLFAGGHGYAAPFDALRRLMAEPELGEK